MYDLSNVLDVDQLSSVPPGSSILVTGPAMTGKEDLLGDVLASGVVSGDGAVTVTTGDQAEDIVADLQRRTDGVNSHAICAIDCRAEGSREEDELENGAYVNRVPSPSDMTGIGIGVTKCFERLHDAGLDRGRLGLTNLSTMVTYSDRQTVFKFCHVLSSRLDSANYLGVFSIDSGAHDNQTLQVIKQAFDAQIEVRETEGTREARVMGLEPEPSPWVEL